MCTTFLACQTLKGRKSSLRSSLAAALCSPSVPAHVRAGSCYIMASASFLQCFPGIISSFSTGAHAESGAAPPGQHGLQTAAPEVAADPLAPLLAVTRDTRGGRHILQTMQACAPHVLARLAQLQQQELDTPPANLPVWFSLPELGAALRGTEPVLPPSIALVLRVVHEAGVALCTAAECRTYSAGMGVSASIHAVVDAEMGASSCGDYDAGFDAVITLAERFAMARLDPADASVCCPYHAEAADHRQHAWTAGCGPVAAADIPWHSQAADLGLGRGSKLHQSMRAGKVPAGSLLSAATLAALRPALDAAALGPAHAARIDNVRTLKALLAAGWPAAAAANTALLWAARAGAWQCCHQLLSPMAAAHQGDLAMQEALRCAMVPGTFARALQSSDDWRNEDALATAWRKRPPIVSPPWSVVRPGADIVALEATDLDTRGWAVNTTGNEPELTAWAWEQHAPSKLGGRSSADEEGTLEHHAQVAAFNAALEQIHSWCTWAVRTLLLGPGAGPGSGTAGASRRGSMAVVRTRPGTAIPAGIRSTLLVSAVPPAPDTTRSLWALRRRAVDPLCRAAECVAACAQGHLLALQSFLGNESVIASQSALRAALVCAVESGSESCAIMLLTAPYADAAQNEWELLRRAAYAGHVHIVRLLLRLPDADPNAGAAAALHAAMAAGDVQTSCALLCDPRLRLTAAFATRMAGVAAQHGLLPLVSLLHVIAVDLDSSRKDPRAKSFHSGAACLRHALAAGRVELPAAYAQVFNGLHQEPEQQR